jgi:hypothetical protein
MPRATPSSFIRLSVCCQTSSEALRRKISKLIENGEMAETQRSSHQFLSFLTVQSNNLDD